MNYGYNGSNFTDLWYATRSHYSKKLIDALPRAHPLLDMVASRGNVQPVSSGVGKRNVETILARPIKNLRWIKFDDTITRNVDKVLEQFEWDWKFCYQDFVMYDKMYALNKSDAIVDLLEINQKAIRQGFAMTMAKQLYSTGYGNATGLEMSGLPYLISENPYKENLYVFNLRRGGNPGDSQEFWRNRVGEWVRNKIDTPSPQWPDDRDAQAKELVEGMTNMVNVLNSSTFKLDGIFCNYEMYNLYVYYMREKMRIQNTSEQKKDVGFSSVEFMGIPVYLDKNCPTNQMYFINADTIYWKYLENENFQQTIKELPQHFAKQYIMTLISNFIIHQPRTCGVLTINENSNGLPEDCNVCNMKSFRDYDYDLEFKDTTNNSDTTIENSDYSGSGVYRGDTVGPVPPNKAGNLKDGKTFKTTTNKVTPTTKEN